MHRLLILLVLAACSASPTLSPADPAGSWQLVAGTSDGAAMTVPPDHPITLMLEPSSVGGISACNYYGGQFRTAGEGIQMGQIEQTLRGCEEAIQAAEAAYLSALRTVTSIGMDGDALVLAGPGTELRFDRLQDPPTADLVDVAWTLETLFVGDVATEAAGEPASLELRSDGTFSGSTGCRTFTGTWIEAGDQIHATAMEMTEVDCAAGLADQDGHVVSVIGDGFVPTIEGDSLTLLDPGSIGLVYRRSE